MQKKKMVGLILAIFLLVGAGSWGWQQWKASQVSTNMVLSGNVDVREVTLAFRGSDRIADILVQEGDQVHQGDVLARLDTQVIIGL